MLTSKMIVLKSSDGETFEVEETASQTIKHMIKDNYANTSIPLPNVTSSILAKVIEYCKKHARVVWEKELVWCNPDRLSQRQPRRTKTEDLDTTIYTHATIKILYS